MSGLREPQPHQLRSHSGWLKPPPSLPRFGYFPPTWLLIPLSGACGSIKKPSDDASYMNRLPTCTFLLSLIPPPGASAGGRTVYHQQTLGTSRIPSSYPIVIGVGYLTSYCRVWKGVVNKAERGKA